MAFLRREYMVFGNLCCGLFVFLAWKIGINTAISFLVGAVCSILAGYIGMSVATRANVRTANAAQEGQNKALGIAFPVGQ